MHDDLEGAPSAFLEAIQELKHCYSGFTWESQIWTQWGHRRSPYRVLVLFGLSPRTKDRLLVEMCRRFFEEFPDLPSLLDQFHARRSNVEAIIRKGQIPLIESVVRVLTEHEGLIPKDRDALQRINGVGEKVAECVIAYG